MAILKNVEVYWARLDPKHPNVKLHPENPTWELQIRTKSKEQQKEWKDLNIKTVAVRENPEDEESKIIYWRANLKKKKFKLGKDKAGKSIITAEETDPVEVLDGKRNKVDPASVGNGSVCNIRIFQHDYVFEGKPGIASVLMGIQLVKHIVYVPKPIEEFDDAETETILPEDKPAGAEGPHSDDEF